MEQTNNEIDFYYMGINWGKDVLYGRKTMYQVDQMATQIEKQYGEYSKIEFEMGVVTYLSERQNNKPLTREDLEGATTEFGVEGERNNSYFGCSGTSKKYIDGSYNTKVGRRNRG